MSDDNLSLLFGQYVLSGLITLLIVLVLMKDWQKKEEQKTDLKLPKKDLDWLEKLVDKL